MYARGCIVGITRGTSRNHIIRAAEESIAYQSLDLIRAMEKDLGSELKELKVDGGASRDAFLMQFQADIIGGAIQRPVVRETTALGAAYLAGLAVGFWKNLDEVKAFWRCDVRFTASMDAAKRDRLLSAWHKAVERSGAWAE
jgi:glycerol kinase